MALKVRRYDLRGVYRGQKATYSACTTARTAVAATANTISHLTASSTKTIRLQKVIITGTVVTAAAYLNISLRKTSTVATGGTAVALVATPYISTSAAATPGAVAIFTAAPTSGTVVGTLATATTFGALTGTPAIQGAPIVFDYTTESEQETPTLVAGTTQSFDLLLATATANAPSVDIQWIWTEE